LMPARLYQLGDVSLKPGFQMIGNFRMIAQPLPGPEDIRVRSLL
jgi:hypothetical protein